MPPDSAVPAIALRRHRLARLHPHAWVDMLAREWDPVARDCLAHWAAHGLPLVMTTQRAPPADGRPTVSLGLAAPLRWERRRLALQVPRAGIASECEFPQARDIVDSLPPASRPAFAALARAVAESGAGMRVFGSHGWQRLTGLPYVRDGSDVDLCVAVDSAEQADEVAAHLQAFAADRLRLDGELMFADGAAVHWREWSDWRRGATLRLLVKRLDGAVLAHDFAEQAGA